MINLNLWLRLSEADEALEYLFQWGSIDWQQGSCSSFQIYNTEGELVFDSKPETEESREAV